MSKFFISFFIILSLLPAFISCDKDKEPLKPPIATPTPPDPGEFIGTIDGTSAWSPPTHYAVYYPRFGQLYIIASDSVKYLTAGINLDYTTPLKSYVLESHGDNVAAIKTVEWFHTDHNAADAGGRFSLLKFDTVQKLVSAQLELLGYSATRASKLVFSSSSVKDIALRIDTLRFNGNTGSCTVTGARTTDWESKDVEARISCKLSARDRTLRVEIFSMVTREPDGRVLVINIPVAAPGVYQILPDLPANSNCDTTYATAKYSVNNKSNSYYATTGSLNIISIDTFTNKLKATFDITLRDTSSRQETIKITNGKINLAQWLE